MPEANAGAIEPGSNNRLERREAEMLVRGLNLLFNRCVSYSFAHPLVQETLPKVYDDFRLAIVRCGSLNILLQEAMFFVDAADVMYQPNNRRIADHLRRFGIESLTLSPGFTVEDFSVLVDACALTYPDPNAFLNYYQTRGGAHLGVNKVALRAISETDSVVSGGLSSAMDSHGTLYSSGGSEGSGGENERFEDMVLRAMMGRLSASELEGNVVLAQMLSDPQALGRTVLDASQGAAPASRPGSMGQMVLNVLSHFATNQAKQGFSVEELLAGIYAMRSEMMSMVRTQRHLDQNLAEEEIEAATDTAFDQTVCRIIAEEWKNAKGNFKRVAHVVGRVVPGKKELRRILPRLKESLLANGATIQQWYELVAELSNQLSGEQALRQLSEAAQEFGASPDEILGELKKDPRGAARLLMVASEIRRSGGDPTSDQAMQAFLTGVEQASDRLVEQAGQNSADAIQSLGMLNRLHGELHQELGNRGLPDEVHQTVGKKLDLRVNRAMSELKARALAGQIRDTSTSLDEKVGVLGELVRDEGEIDGIMGLAMALIGPDDLAQTIGRQIAEKVRARLHDEKERSVARDLPQGVYPKAVAEFFLRYEIRRAVRYGVPFTALLVSFQGLPEEREALERDGGSLRGLANVLTGDLRRALRDVDFVGSLGYNRLLVVLPMTVDESADVVAKKIKERLCREVALPDGSRIWVRPRCGTTVFTREDGGGLREVMNRLSQKWQEDL